MTVSTFRFRVRLPRHIRLQGKDRSREEFFAWAWGQFEKVGLLGIHEGTMLSAEAAERGFETESFTVDAAEAPRERDWVRDQAVEEAEFYFGSRKQADSASARLVKTLGLEVSEVREQPPEDWDAEWKKSFRGVWVPPGWHVQPPWEDSTRPARKPGERVLLINPGAGFGTGTHETTQLCLTCMTEMVDGGQRPARVLDFGSGSGILAIGAALLGCPEVTGVEIDPLAIDNAVDNAKLNHLDGKIDWLKELPAGAGPFDLVIANILRPVLLDCVGLLTSHLAARGGMILSGLVEADVSFVAQAYTPVLGRAPEIRSNGEWRALVWKPEVGSP